MVGLFPDSKSRTGKIGLGTGKNGKENGSSDWSIGGKVTSRYDDSINSAARFFYCVAKASKAERGEGNNHPTVKPLKLMCYLCRLVTPPGGTVLDCYVGSGTTGVSGTDRGL